MKTHCNLLKLAGTRPDSSDLALTRSNSLNLPLTLFLITYRVVLLLLLLLLLLLFFVCWGVLRIVSVVGCWRIALVPPSRVRRVRIRVSARRGCVLLHIYFKC